MKLPRVNPKLITAVLLIAVCLAEIRKGYFKGFKTYLKSAPWKSLALVSLLTALLVIVTAFFDRPVLQFIQDINHSFFQMIVDLGGYLGKGQNLWTLVCWLYLVAFVLRLEKARLLLFSSLLASFIASLMTTILKFTILRARPEAQLGPFSFFNWKGLIEDDRFFQSFPSGDVAVVAGAAIYLFFSLKNRYVKWLFLLFPIFTACARVNANRHWPSDTLASIGLGVLAAQFIWNYQKAKSRA